MPAPFAPLTVRVPATSANLGPGFDCLGLSLALHTTLRLTPVKATEVQPTGDMLRGTPASSSNYVYKCMEVLAREVGRPLPPLRLEIESEVPLARGLGSSASALVGGLLAANTVLGGPLSRADLLNLAAREEGHPDNVAPALLGGFVVAVLADAMENGPSEATYIRSEPPAHLAATLLIPDTKLSTHEARAALPTHYTRADAVYNVGRAALLTGAMLSDRLDALAEAMADRLHQPYRAPLVPVLGHVLEGAAQHGALGAALSGAGPTVLCLRDARQPTANLHAFLHGALRCEGVSGRVLDVPLDTAGAVVEGG